MGLWGGDRGGGRSKTKKPGGQPGNINRRASKFLPKAADTEDRRRFLDALEQAEGMSASDKARTILDFVFARAASFAEEVGIGRLVEALRSINDHRLTDDKLAGRDRAARREQLLHRALADIWQVIGETEHAVQVDQILTALQLGLLQIGGGADENREWMGRAAASAEADGETG